MNRQSAQEREAATAGRSSFRAALSALAHHPFELVRLWNWKSALLSLILRGPIFLVATVRQGWQAALSALFTESVFCVLTAGFYGAVVQTLRSAEPMWLTLTFITLVIPALFQIFEYGLHWLRGTPHLRLVEIVSVAVSGVSALFNWYAMRRGTLLVGGEGSTFGRDLRQLPRLLFNFITARWLRRPREIDGLAAQIPPDCNSSHSSSEDRQQCH